MAYPDVVEAHVTGNLQFQVRFSDGLEGHAEMRPAHLFGVFERLKDPDYFKRIAVTDGFVSWPDDIDLAPDAMYEAIRDKGEWVLG